MYLEIPGAARHSRDQHDVILGALHQAPRSDCSPSSGPSRSQERRDTFLGGEICSQEQEVRSQVPCDGIHSLQVCIRLGSCASLTNYI